MTRGLLCYLVIWLSMGLNNCIEICGKEFSTPKGLKIHQKTCQKFLHEDPQLRHIQQCLQDKVNKSECRVSPGLPENGDSGIEHLGDGSLFQQEVPTPPSPSEQHSTDTIEPLPISPLPQGRGMRKKRPTWRVLEQLPQPSAPIPLEEPTAPSIPPSITEHTPSVSLPTRIIRSAINIFGTFREYTIFPTHDPDETTALEDLSSIPRNSALSPPVSSPLAPPVFDYSPHVDTITPAESIAPFSSWSIFALLNWMWTGSRQKSHQELDRLVKEVLLDPRFISSDLANFSSTRETAKLDSHFAFQDDGWVESDVHIEVPDGQRHHSPDDPPIPVFSISGLHRRSIVSVIRSIWSDSSSRYFHFIPFKNFWRRSPDINERLHGELYTSDSFIKAHEALQSSPREPGCSLERVVCGLMFWSDSTHLASFGNASLWPLYLFFGNQSKYTRCRPGAGACHHIAYIPKLPDSFYDFYIKLTGRAPTPEILTHCRRELMHAVWSLLLDPEFIKAYVHGIVVRCADGIERRIYPRIFTYSADYPEKVLLAGIRNQGLCPCPRCKIEKTQLNEVGMKRDDNRRSRDVRDSTNTQYHVRVDNARTALYEHGKSIKSTAVDSLLAETSVVPTYNAFGTHLSLLGFNFFPMFVVDLMHEFELGVWKAVFIHFIRMLVTIPGNVIHTFNERFRQVPRFGRSTIRRFNENTSALKKLAARDYEDFLQCSLPVFEGLFPEKAHDKAIQDIIFILADWHALAKLRLHSDSTISLLRTATRDMGTKLRHFVRHICPLFDTRELPREVAARARRQKRKNSANLIGSRAQPPKSLKQKMLNLFTYKFHALGDYAPTIPFVGTSDSYSTQPGELEHRRVKKFYARTNKVHYVRQITRLERREQALERRRAKLKKLALREEPKRRRTMGRTGTCVTVGLEESEFLGHTTPDVHHHISHSRNFPVSLRTLCAEYAGDPAIKDFIPKLQDHLIHRFRSPGVASNDETFSCLDRKNIQIQANRIFRHKVMRVNYTSYDIRRCQDSMNPRTQADILLPAPDLDPETGVSLTGHPFVYARVIGVFHADVLYNPTGSRPVMMPVEFLWVRRYRLDVLFKGGFSTRRLHRLELVPEEDATAFGFVDPDDVIRGVHLLPGFCYGTITEMSTFMPCDTLWKYYYVNFFVDRDMYMRFRGNGVGHSFVPIKNHDTRPIDAMEIEHADSDPEIVASSPTKPKSDSDSDSDTTTTSDESETENAVTQHAGDIENEIDGTSDFDPEDGEGDIVDLENDTGFGDM